MLGFPPSLPCALGPHFSQQSGLRAIRSPPPGPQPSVQNLPSSCTGGTVRPGSHGAAWAPRCPPAACRDGGSAQSGVCLPGQVGLWRKALSSCLEPREEQGWELGAV